MVKIKQTKYLKIFIQYTVDSEMFEKIQFSLIFANSLSREFKVLANIDTLNNLFTTDDGSPIFRTLFLLIEGGIYTILSKEAYIDQLLWLNSPVCWF